MFKRIQNVMVIIGFLITLTACSGSEPLTITDPWARPAMKDGNGAVYMVLENHSDSEDTLLSAYTDAATVVELHDVIIGSSMEDGEDMQDSGEMSGDNSMMKMDKQENVPIAAGETVTFKPGSLHVMLIGLTNDLNEGETITLTLVFRTAGEITIEVPVEQR